MYRNLIGIGLFKKNIGKTTLSKGALRMQELLLFFLNEYIYVTILRFQKDPKHCYRTFIRGGQNSFSTAGNNARHGLKVIVNQGLPPWLMEKNKQTKRKKAPVGLRSRPRSPDPGSAPLLMVSTRLLERRRPYPPTLMGRIPDSSAPPRRKPDPSAPMKRRPYPPGPDPPAPKRRPDPPAPKRRRRPDLPATTRRRRSDPPASRSRPDPSLWLCVPCSTSRAACSRAPHTCVVSPLCHRTPTAAAPRAPPWRERREIWESAVATSTERGRKRESDAVGLWRVETEGGRGRLDGNLKASIYMKTAMGPPMGHLGLCLFSVAGF